MSETTVQVKEEVKVERAPGARGEPGQPTAALTIRQMWHHAFFERVGGHGNRREWVVKLGVNAPSLKRFARGLVAKGDQVAKDWFAHKKGSLNLKRSDANEKAAREAFIATKTERRKKAANNAAKTVKAPIV